MDAFGNALAERILSGACTKFEGGEAVFLYRHSSAFRLGACPSSG